MLYIIIPVFNRWQFTKACLERLNEQTYTSFQIVVVDDGSTDETAVELASLFPKVTVLNGDGNLWWTASINLGITHALAQGAEYILSLNNDTLPQADYLEKLLAAAKRKPNALIGSMGIDTTNNTINFCGEQIQWLTDTTKDLRTEVNVEEQDQLLKVTHFPGRGLLIHKSVFDRIGLFDQDAFPHYMGDFDFTFRARKAGFDIYCSVNAQLGTYPEASGANKLMAEKTFKNYKEHLFGMKGAANLKYYFTYVFRHCPWYLLPFSVSIGTTKRLTSYWLKK